MILLPDDQIIQRLEPVRKELQSRAQKAISSNFSWASHLANDVVSAQYPIFTKWIHSHLKANGIDQARIIDWGGQYGQMCVYLRELGHDVESFMLERPAGFEYFESLGFDYQIGSLSDPVSLPYEDHSVDAVLSIGVLEHVRTELTSETDNLKEIRRVLKPGGLFFCAMLPNQYSLLENSYSLLNRWHHQYRYSRRGIRGMLNATGFDIREHKQSEFLPKSSFRPSQWLGKIIGPYRVHYLDEILTKWPGIRVISQHHTIVASSRTKSNNGAST